ncbi:uncharacterized protein F4822DRAFT_294625 [Hypoxylon trugodes]|uniref:uncharacterized protein n=1 Tax=Hypoxylon trugodes TaxID=326681 RepID=UPI0021911706|nr:uncharacterized protein F4822DRAFT_294625 [Hypoxylon trugodes]KAI1387872.1 hypothetical protein F4822DRAFT_294625 [Hypoxylon trugodes]
MSSGTTVNTSSSSCGFLAALDRFKKASGLTRAEEADFQMTTLDELKSCIRTIQQDQEQKRRMMYMRRLDPYLQTMEQYGKVLDVFVNTSEIVAFIWGPMKFILLIVMTYSDALHSVLDTYQDIGEQIPLLKGYQQFFASNAHMKIVLVQIYEDILEFHRETIKYLKQRLWKQLFQATWRGFTVKIQHLKDNLRRHRSLIESHATIVQFEEIQRLRDCAKREFEAHSRAETDRRRQRVVQWLSAFNAEGLQCKYREMRSISGDAGRWLITDSRFQKWLDPHRCQWPLLWINGIPGAGKTILASVIVDEVRCTSQVSNAFFYCKYGDLSRNTFVSVARSLLVQLLEQNSHLLQPLYEKASISGEVELTSKTMAKDLLCTALNSCGTTYIILDGLDECGRESRKEITTWFESIIDDLPPADVGTIRCLFVSQDDGVARKDFALVPSIKIQPSDNKSDLRNFAEAWHKRLEERFGTLRGNAHITNIIYARAQGMFLFAKLLAEHFYGQSSRENLLLELDPAVLPVELDDAYSRILQRITEGKSQNLIAEIHRILGWVVCAPRPLRWREIQATISLDLENQEVNHERRLLDTPKDLFASLVELQPNDTVDLIHSTARAYLIRSSTTIPVNTHLSLALTSVGFLGFPEIDISRTEEELKDDITEGRLAFYDYASACWTIHLQTGIRHEEGGKKLTPLIETLEAFIDLHWSKTAKLLVISKTTHEGLKPLSQSGLYTKIAQAVGWSKKQLGEGGRGPSEEEALDLQRITSKLRAVLEKCYSTLSQREREGLEQFYGQKWFKCPRINCYFYHEGFNRGNERDDHMARHERPFMCIVDGCHMATFGCVTESALKAHLFEYHGVDLLDEMEFPEPKKPTTSLSKNEATYSCSLCAKKFTRAFNLRSHMRTHTNEKPFVCSTCDERFTRKNDCARHERGHGEKKFKCTGPLEDGTSWGCKAAFGRADKLASHLRSKNGQKCIRPLIMQELQNGRRPSDGNDFLIDRLDLDADNLLSAGTGLPTFAEFLDLCGLNKSIIDPDKHEEPEDSKH